MSDVGRIETATKDHDTIRLPSDKCRLANQPPKRLVPGVVTRMLFLAVTNKRCK